MAFGGYSTTTEPLTPPSRRGTFPNENTTCEAFERGFTLDLVKPS